MFSQSFRASLLSTALALTLAGGAAAQQEAAAGAIDAAASQLARHGEGFASSASIEVLPMKMAGSCPRAFMLKIDLGAEASGKLAYQIETLDGRVSQVFETRARADREGGYVARVQHEIALQRGQHGDGAARVAFSAPPSTEPAPEPGFFERLFGTAAERDPSKGLAQQSFRVKVVAPNEVVSTFDSPSATCETEQLLFASEDQRDGDRDRPGRDRPGRDRDTPGRDGGRGSGPAGASPN